jgi:hypothetical protein
MRWFRSHKSSCTARPGRHDAMADATPSSVELLAQAHETLSRLEPIPVPEPEAEKPKPPTYVYARVGPNGTISYLPPPNSTRGNASYKPYNSLRP